jgi:hypothetical protein
MRRIVVLAVITGLAATSGLAVTAHVTAARSDRLECKGLPGVPTRVFPGMPALPGQGCPPGFG